MYSILSGVFIFIVHGVLADPVANVTTFEKNDKRILQTLVKEVAALKDDLRDVQEKLMNITYELNNNTPKPSNHALFFARLSNRDILGDNNIVKFDEEKVDEGNNYNPYDGIFVAPATGYYQFSWTIFGGKYVDTEIRVDNLVIDSMYAQNALGAQTKLVISKVMKGQHVWIQTSRSIDHIHYLTAPNGSRCSFMGLLLY